MASPDLSILPAAATAALIGLLSLPGTAPAGEALPFGKEVDSCLAAVNAQVATERARRVRHVVSNAKPTGIGYVLTIETAVFFEGSEKKYEAYCVASGSNAPLTLKIEELET